MATTSLPSPPLSFAPPSYSQLPQPSSSTITHLDDDTTTPANQSTSKQPNDELFETFAKDIYSQLDDDALSQSDEDVSDDGIMTARMDTKDLEKVNEGRDEITQHLTRVKKFRTVQRHATLLAGIYADLPRILDAKTLAKLDSDASKIVRLSDERMQRSSKVARSFSNQSLPNCWDVCASLCEKQWRCASMISRHGIEDEKPIKGKRNQVSREKEVESMKEVVDDVFSMVTTLGGAKKELRTERDRIDHLNSELETTCDAINELASLNGSEVFKWYEWLEGLAIREFKEKDLDKCLTVKELGGVFGNYRSDLVRAQQSISSIFSQLDGMENALQKASLYHESAAGVFRDHLPTSTLEIAAAFRDIKHAWGDAAEFFRRLQPDDTNLSGLQTTQQILGKSFILFLSFLPLRFDFPALFRRKNSMKFLSSPSSNPLTMVPQTTAPFLKHIGVALNAIEDLPFICNAVKPFARFLEAYVVDGEAQARVDGNLAQIKTMGEDAARMSRKCKGTSDEMTWNHISNLACLLKQILRECLCAPGTADIVALERYGRLCFEALHNELLLESHRQHTTTNKKIDKLEEQFGLILRRSRDDILTENRACMRKIANVCRKKINILRSKSDN